MAENTQSVRPMISTNARAIAAMANRADQLVLKQGNQVLQEVRLNYVDEAAKP